MPSNWRPKPEELHCNILCKVHNRGAYEVSAGFGPQGNGYHRRALVNWVTTLRITGDTPRESDIALHHA